MINLNKSCIETSRKPLTTTHPHGYLFVDSSKKFGLVPISKNASTTVKAAYQLNFKARFADFDGASVCFLRDPYDRFISSIPETLLRLTDTVRALPDRKDQVVVPEEIYEEVCSIARLSVRDMLSSYIEMVSYCFFDAHHEPQLSFVTDRSGNLRINPLAFSVNEIDIAFDQISNRFGLVAKKHNLRLNQSGSKPLTSRNVLIDIFRVMTGTGVHRVISLGGPLMMRYHSNSGNGPISISKLNKFCNDLSLELTHEAQDTTLRKKVEKIYEKDMVAWRKLNEIGGNIEIESILP